MFIKFAKCQVIQKVARNDLIKLANKNKTEMDLDTDNYAYYRVRAISAMEKHGYNENFDAFPAEELKKSYRTFIGCNVYKDHNNTDDRFKYGYVLDAEYVTDNPEPDDNDWVMLIIGVHRTLQPDSPEMVRRLDAGIVTDTSMGCMVEESLCSVCLAESEGDRSKLKYGQGIARASDEYCEHIRNKGSIYKLGYVEEPSYEINEGLHFFDESLITTQGADLSAKVLEKVAEHDKNCNHKKAVLVSKRILDSNGDGGGDAVVAPYSKDRFQKLKDEGLTKEVFDSDLRQKKEESISQETLNVAIGISTKIFADMLQQGDLDGVIKLILGNETIEVGGPTDKIVKEKFKQKQDILNRNRDNLSPEEFDEAEDTLEREKEVFDVEGKKGTPITAVVANASNNKGIQYLGVILSRLNELTKANWKGSIGPFRKYTIKYDINDLENPLVDIHSASRLGVGDNPLSFLDAIAELYNKCLDEK